MTKYISLLRGINVSGHKKILMKDLKTLYEDLGLKNVLTYIQSGNVVFESDSSSAKKIQRDIESAIEAAYGFSVNVDVRSSSDFKSVLDKLPFTEYDLDQDGTKIIITFLSDSPSEEAITKLSERVVAPEQMKPGNKSLYFRFPEGYGKTKLTNVLMERILNVSTTARNLKTVVKLCALAQG